MGVWAWLFIVFAVLSFSVFDNSSFGYTALVIANVYVVGARLERGRE